MRKHRVSFLLFVSMVAVSLLLSGCKKDESSTAPVLSNTDIPHDPGGVAPITTMNNIVSIGGTFSKTPGNESRVRLNLLGIKCPVTGNVIQFAAGSSLWITEDNVLKGIKITTAGSGNVLQADVVFTVDNSGSMGNEADSIASKIIAFSNILQASGLNVKVGVVGYYGYVDGAKDLTDAASLSTYLNRTYGTSRTIGFSGTDSSRLATAAETFASSHSSYSENGIVGIWFADSVFSWRSGANRVYINFTDEGIQTDDIPYWTTGGLATRWTAGKGTIHTVFSTDYWNGTVPDTSTDRENYTSWQQGTWERPWGLSTLTGGTINFAHGDGSDFDLTTLPVTGSLATSALVEYVTASPTGMHSVTITVRNGTSSDGKKEYLNITY